MLAGAGEKAFCTGGDQSARRQLRRPWHRIDDGELHRRHPRRAQAGDRARADGLRHRRRQRARHDLRPNDLFRERDLRPGRPEDGIGRSGYGTAFLARVGGRRRRARSGTSTSATRARKAVDGPRQHLRPYDQLDERCKWAETCERSPDRIAIASAASTWTPHQSGIAGMGMTR